MATSTDPKKLWNQTSPTSGNAVAAQQSREATAAQAPSSPAAAGVAAASDAINAAVKPASWYSETIGRLNNAKAKISRGLNAAAAHAAPSQPAQPAATTSAASTQQPAAPAKPSYNGVEYDPNADYMALMQDAVKRGDYTAAAQYEKLRNAKIQGEGLNFEQTKQYASYLPESQKSYDGVDYNTAIDYMAKIQDAVKRGDYAAAAQYEKQRNAKIQGEGLQNFETTNLYGKYIPTTPEAAGMSNPATILSQMTELLNQWKEASAQQQTGQIDYATQQAVTELERALADAAPQYQTQRNQIAADERKAMDNAALYAEARGDRGGIGQEQYNLIQSSAAQSRLAVSQAQTKLKTDIQRQIADLRAKGEFDKADAALTITQQYLAQLMDLQKWQIEYSMDYAQFQEQLRQWQVHFDQSMAQLTGKLPNGSLTMAGQEHQNSLSAENDKKAASVAAALLEAGVMPSDAQLQAMGMTKEQARAYILAQGLTVRETGSSSSNGTPKTGNPGSGNPPGPQVNNGSVSTDNIKKLQALLGVDQDGKCGPATQAAAQAKWGTSSADTAWSKYGNKANAGDSGVTYTGGRVQENKNVTNSNGKGWVLVAGYGRITWQELKKYVDSGAIKETKNKDGTYTYTRKR